MGHRRRQSTGDAQLSSGPCHVTNRHHRRRYHRRHHRLCAAERGHHVTVFERHRYAAMETSFANGGQLSASNAEVWNSMATVLKGLRWMFTRDAPLLLNPAPNWHKYSWMAEFLRQIPNYRANTVETMRLAIAAREHLFAIAEREGIDFDLEQRGILHIYQQTEGFRCRREGQSAVAARAA